MLANLLKRFFPHRVIQVDDGDYIIRWFLLGSKGEGDDRWGLRLHKIVKSDSLRHCHDHPYKFVSLILWGGYIEHRPDKSVHRYRPGMLNYKGLDDFHALELRKPAWSLVVTGRRRQDRLKESSDWGFLTEEGWIGWREYE